jgi:hypothetical protein
VLDTVSRFDYLLERELKQEREGKIQHLINNAAVDWADYKYLCGEIHGIQIAMDRIREIRGKVGLAEDE